MWLTTIKRMSKITCRALEITRLGNPREVLQLKTIDVSTKLASKEILVKWLASPINPLDINRMEGTYPGSIAPIVGGSEGVGVVEKASNDSNFKPGDMVIPITNSEPWGEYEVRDDENFIKLRKGIDLISAATLMINPPTAYFMLQNVIKLNPGDYVIQNSANSGVGRAAIEIAKAYGYKTINLIRDRPNIDVLKNELKTLGADHVFTEEEFRKVGRKVAEEYDIKLALNGVGGRSALAISSALSPGGTMVTYGGMSKKPSEIATGALVFKGIKVCGFAVGKWMQIPENRPQVVIMFDDLQQLIIEGKLHPPPIETHELNNFTEAIERTIEGKYGKQLLFIHPDYKNYNSKL
uniref:Enoyl reductase (ER) domain-containing protein n=1 Tax=Panagrolaimus sp. JU765 TaxID=591449 RepID=A0AC34QTR6_9BILA